jgi:pimeloyl-ACP methyl ester carboxylesterase
MDGGPTLLVGHSYGGAVITGAGRATNVVGLVYVAAFAPGQGESVNSILAGSDPAPGWASISPAFDDDLLWHRQDTFHDAFCQDLDDTESLIMATTQRPLARRCFDDVTREPAWNTKPSWYQVSAQDRMIRRRPSGRWLSVSTPAKPSTSTLVTPRSPPDRPRYSN